MSNYLHNLQNADDATKMRWGIGITAVLMVLVIYVWLAYFNTLVAPAGTTANTDVSSDTGFSFWETTKQETASMYTGFQEQMGKLKEMIATPKEYEIEPRQ